MAHLILNEDGSIKQFVPSKRICDIYNDTKYHFVLCAIEVDGIEIKETTLIKEFKDMLDLNNLFISDDIVRNNILLLMDTEKEEFSIITPKFTDLH